MQYKVEMSDLANCQYDKFLNYIYNVLMKPLMSLKPQSEKNFPHGMSLDEINEEIRRARYDGDETE